MMVEDIIDSIVKVDTQTLNDEIIETIETASDEDLHEWLREIRHNRTAETFVVEKKERKNKKVDNLLNSMSPQEMAALLQMLDAK